MTRFWFRTSLAILFGALVLCLMNGSADAGWRHRHGRCGGWGGCGGGYYGGGGCCGSYNGGGKYGSYYGGGTYYGGGPNYGGNGAYYGGQGIPAAPNVGPDYAPGARSAGRIDANTGGARVNGGIRSQSDRGPATGADLEGRAGVNEGGARAAARAGTDVESPPPPPAAGDRPSELPAPRSQPPAESPTPDSRNEET